MPPWLLVVAGVLFGGTGVTGLVSLVFNRSSQKSTDKAKVVDQAIDVLTKLNDRLQSDYDRREVEHASELAKKDAEIARKDAEIAALTAKRRSK